MKILRANDIATRIHEPSGEVRKYFLFDSFEFIVTMVPPGHVQEPHLHEQIVEFYYVIEGQMSIKEGTEMVDLLAGEAVCLVPNGLLHEISNQSDKPLTIATLKLPPNNASYRELFKNDKFTSK